MKNITALEKYPKKHIKAYDGMSITAEVWSQAHDEHRLAKQAHNLNLHGSGIISGLEVVANDPPDQYVFISPGAAVDSAGNVIVLSEPVAYDFGDSAEGTLFLLLAHGEREIGGIKKEAKYLQYEFVITARPSLPKRPAVELGRVTVLKTGNPIKNADDARHPEPNSLDPRFRNEITPVRLQTVRVLVLGLGADIPDMLEGWNYLAQACAQTSSYKLIIDSSKSLPNDLRAYDLIYLGCQDNFSLKAASIKSLTAYLEQGNALFVEALEETADEPCQNLLKKLKCSLKKVKAKDALLRTPFLFNTPLAGFSGKEVQVGKNVLYTSASYSLAWAGRTKSGTGSRADIRTSHEWGVNLIHHLITKTEA